MKPIEWYSLQINVAEQELKKVQKQIIRVSMLRVLLFIAGITFCILFWQEVTWKLILGIGGILIPFLILVKIHNKLFYLREWLSIKCSINQKEIKALKNDYSDFDTGKEFIHTEHPYSHDLDLFGNHSLFQAINRTCTHIGKRKLAAWMQTHLTDKQLIEKRQECIKDLSVRTEFREKFQITGIITQNKQTDINEIEQWSLNKLRWVNHTWVKLILWGVPGINLSLFIAGLTGSISWNWLLLSISLFVIISFGVIKHATHIQQEYGNKLKILNSYAKLIALCQKEEWKATGLQELINSLNINGKSPTEALGKLSKELDRLDLRNNQLLYVILEGTMFFQLHQIVQIEKWKEEYGASLIKWLDIVGEIDALCSMGNFAYNHPQYNYPVIVDQPFCFKATQMGHPLMDETKCIKNEADIPFQPFFLIITGANMAGKSTYLRTIGVNYLLACLGCPVCCESLSIYPAKLITSLRTTDSLSDNESYFFAELKRLKGIIDLLNKGEKLFIILDEILKGTNSSDKQKGSFDLIRQFMTLQTNGIIATHDLLLGKLIEQYPQNIRNYCFEAEIKENELFFSYKLRKGIAQNMNACFLMKKMGIIIQE